MVRHNPHGLIAPFCSRAAGRFRALCRPLFSDPVVRFDVVHDFPWVKMQQGKGGLLLLLLLIQACTPTASAHSKPAEPPKCSATALACRWECITGRSDPGCYTVQELLQPAAAANEITLVTQATRDKARYLKRALDFWDGPASIALYAYTPLDLAFFINFSCTRCTISVVYGGTREQAYPINLLRNVALTAAQTSLAFMFDTDFLPSPGLYHLLSAHIANQSSTRRTGWVVPAFEMKTNYDIPTDFLSLRNALEVGAVGIFHGKRGGHYNTQNSRWLNTSNQYCLEHSAHNYEPYLVLNKTEPGFPLFDPTFVDRGMNKVRIGCIFDLHKAHHPAISYVLQVMWVRELKARDYRFCVVPRAWLVHVYERRPKYRPFFAKRGGVGDKSIKLLPREEVPGESIRLELPDKQTLPAK